MRDPERIDRILDKLKRYWSESPDLRLGQIVCNANTARRRGPINPDPFHMEDDTLERYLDAKLDGDGDD